MNGSLRHVAVALLTAASLIVSPAYAQAQQGQNQGPAKQQQGQTAAGAQPASQPGAQTGVGRVGTGARLERGHGCRLLHGKADVPEHFRALRAAKHA